MDIKKNLHERAALVESALLSYYKKKDSDIDEVIEAQIYALMSGGKRVRPYLTLEFCKLFGEDEKKALPYACAIEMIHTYSLIHDDLPCMDNDLIRRGKPSCHAKFGETVALLAGDALLTEAFFAVAANASLSPEQNVRAAAILSRAAGTYGMVGGQMMDLDDREKTGFERLLKLHGMKTGEMIRAAVLLGCIAAGIDENDERFADAEAYAKKIGLTFQIVDDILDHREGQSEEDKETFLTYFDDEKSYEYAKKLTREAVAAIEKYEGSEELVAFAKFLLDRQI